MPVSFSVLTPERRLELAYSLLRTISDHPDWTARRVREEFARANDLTDWCVRRLVDLLFFSDMIRTEWRWLPAERRVSVHYRVLPAGQAVLTKGSLEMADLAAVPPRWLRAVSRPARPAIAYLRVETPTSVFEWWFQPDWHYRVYVRTWRVSPTEDWQAPLDPRLLLLQGVSPKNTGESYAVKHRTIITMGTALGLGGKEREVFGYKFVRYDERTCAAAGLEDPLIYIRTRLSGLHSVPGVPSLQRTMVYDPGGGVEVRRLSPQGGRDRWEVDFSAFSSKLPPTLDTEALASTFRARTGRHAALQPAVWLPPPVPGPE